MTVLLGAVPILAAIALILLFGVETQKKALETITAEEMERRLAQPV